MHTTKDEILNLPPGSRCLIDEMRIKTRVAELAAGLSELMSEDRSSWLVIGVLRGAFIFMADLVRELAVAAELDFIQISSYEQRTCSSGRVELICAPRSELKNRPVLLVDDILDTGYSLAWLKDYFKRQQVKQLTTCVLLDKPSRREIANLQADYVGFEVPPEFVVGYGLDANQQYRFLSSIYQIPVR